MAVKKKTTKRKSTPRPKARNPRTHDKARGAEILARAQRRSDVQRMVEDGMTYREIALKLSLAPSTISRDVSALKEIWRREHVLQINDMIALEAARLDTILKAIMPQIRGELFDIKKLEAEVPLAVLRTYLEVAFDRQHKAIDLVLKTLDRRLKLYGLDAKALLEQIQNLLEPTDASNAGVQTRRIADGLRELEAIFNRHRGAEMSSGIDSNDDSSGPLN